MEKKRKKVEIVDKPTREYILVPVSWLERLMTLADEDGIGSQHLKGYIASADLIIQLGKCVSEEDYYKL